MIAEDGAVVWTSYHTLSTDVCDPLDNDPASEHYRTCTTARTDGHGRTVDQVLRTREPDSGAPEQHRLWSYYRADGAAVGLVRASSSGARPASVAGPLPEQHALRTFTYDSAGRRLSSADPDSDDPLGAPASRSWRYLFNRAGDLAAVRDPRGCGQNFFYDLGGRLAGEQYVPCAEAQSFAGEQPAESVAGLVGLDHDESAYPLDAVYHYDRYPDWTSDLPAGRDAVPAGASGVLGRATGVTDRAQRSALAYDDRANVTWTTRQLAVLSPALGVTFATYPDGRPRPAEQSSAPAGTVLYDDAHAYTRTASFDHAGRPLEVELPRDPDASPEPLVVRGTLTYDARGLPSSATAHYGAASQPVVAAIEYLRDGLVASVTYGDGSATRAPTVGRTTYDVRRRPVRMSTERAPRLGAEPRTLGAVRTVVDQELVWDAASNLTAVRDHRDAAEWPAGHLPQSVHIRHDALYRVINADFDYTQASGARTPADLGTDWRTHHAAASTQDPMRTRPAPIAVPAPSERVVSLTWSWDYLARGCPGSC